MLSQHTRVNLTATCALFQITVKHKEQVHGPGTVLNYLTSVISFNSHKTMWHWCFHRLQLTMRKRSPTTSGEAKVQTKSMSLITISKIGKLWPAGQRPVLCIRSCFCQNEGIHTASGNSHKVKRPQRGICLGRVLFPKEGNTGHERPWQQVSVLSACRTSGCTVSGYPHGLSG